MADKVTGVVNGLDIDALRGVMGAIEEDPSKGAVGFEVTSEWKGQCKVQTFVSSYDVGGQTVERSHTLLSDEPNELLGENVSANPQELLMAALNSCIMVGYTLGASIRGITLEKLVVKTKGALDLRGFLGMDPDIIPGYDTISYEVEIKGNGTKEQFQDIHETVNRTSPNRFNIGTAIKLDGALKVEE